MFRCVLLWHASKVKITNYANTFLYLFRIISRTRSSGIIAIECEKCGSCCLDEYFYSFNKLDKLSNSANLMQEKNSISSVKTIWINLQFLHKVLNLEMKFHHTMMQKSLQLLLQLLLYTDSWWIYFFSDFRKSVPMSYLHFLFYIIFCYFIFPYRVSFSNKTYYYEKSEYEFMTRKISICNLM